jgi:hypothetical protein
VAPSRIFSANPPPASSTRAPPRQKAPPSYVHAPNAKDEFDEYDTPAPDAEEGDESAKIAAFVSSSASDWDRQKREATGYSGGRGRGGRGGGGRDGGGRGRGQGMPHSSYICHRCKQGGKFTIIYGLFTVHVFPSVLAKFRVAALQVAPFSSVTLLTKERLS